MSYYTVLQLSWDDSDYPKGNIGAQDVVSAAAAYVARNGWHLDVLKDLEGAATAGFGNHAAGWKNIPGFALVRMLQHVSTQLPQVTFFARGIGEEFHDLWLVQIRAGEIQEKSGPFADDL
jgi:hypothetical protein